MSPAKAIATITTKIYYRIESYAGLVQLYAVDFGKIYYRIESNVLMYLIAPSISLHEDLL